MATCCCTQVWVPGQRSNRLPTRQREVRARRQVLLPTHPSPACADGVQGRSRTALSPVLHKARGVFFFSRRNQRRTELGTPQCKRQKRDDCCGAPQQCCRRTAPSHLPSVRTVYTLITQTLLGRLPPSETQQHLLKKRTELHVPGICLPSIFCCEKFLQQENQNHILVYF